MTDFFSAWFLDNSIVQDYAQLAEQEQVWQNVGLERSVVPVSVEG